MNFQDKFDLIIETIEENLDKEYSDIRSVTKELELKLGTPSRVISDTFSFVTNVTLGSYIMKRKLAAACQFKNRNQCSWDDAAEKYGYSEVSAFRRAFKNAYGVTASDLCDAKCNVRLVEPMSIDAVLKGQNEEEKEKMEERLYCDLDTLSQKEMNILDYRECQSLFGMELSMIMLIESMLDDPIKLYIGCMYASREFPGRTACSLSEDEKKCLYMVVNREMDAYTAQQVLETFKDIPMEKFKELSSEYLYVMTALKQEEDKSAELINYQGYLNIRKCVEKNLDRGRMKERMKDDFAFCEPLICWEFDGRDDCMTTAMISVLKCMEKEDIKALEAKECFSKIDEDMIFLMSHYHIKKNLALWIIKTIAPTTSGDVRKIDAFYLKIVGQSGRKVVSDEGQYKRFLETKDKITELGYQDDLELIIQYTFEDNMTFEDAIKESEDRKRILQLSKKYGIEPMKIRFAERISNLYTGEEKAYELLQKTYTEKGYIGSALSDRQIEHLRKMGFDEKKEGFTLNDKLSLILCLNTEKAISECEEQVEVMLKESNLTDEEATDFAWINELQSKYRRSDTFNLVTVTEYKDVKKITEGTELSTPFYMWLVIFFKDKEGLKSLEEAYQRVLEEERRRKAEAK